MSIFSFCGMVGGGAPDSVSRLGSTVFCILLLFLGGCQNSEETDSDSGAEISKRINLTTAELIRDSQPKNGYFSYDADKGVYYRVIPVFVWRGSLFFDADAQFTESSDARYAGFSVQVETDEFQPGLEQICSSSSSIALYPPDFTATGDGAVFGPFAALGGGVITGSGDQCGSDYFRLRALDDDGDGEWDRFQYSFPPGESGGVLLTKMVPGNWQLRNGTALLVDVELPPLSPDGDRPVLPIPRIKRDRGTGLIDSVDIRWWDYDPATGPYEQVDSHDRIHQSTVTLLDSVTGGDIETREEYRAFGLADWVVFPKYPWRANGEVNDGDVKVTNVLIEYRIDGVAYRFVWDIFYSG